MDSSSGGGPRCSVDDGTAEHIVALSVGGTVSLALSSRGRVACWGVNDYGECGPGLAGSLPVEPVWIPGLECVKQIDTDFTSFALSDTGGVWAWGTEIQGELGDGEGMSGPFATPVPVLLPGTAKRVASIRSGGKAELGSGTALWGNVGWEGTFDTPFLWDLPPGSQVFATGNRIYEIDASGKARGKGDNNRGELGDGTLVDRLDFVEVDTEARFRTIFTELWMACGLTTDGELYCWGENYQGSLGVATKENNVKTPVKLSLSNVTDVDLSGIRCTEPLLTQRRGRTHHAFRAGRSLSSTTPALPGAAGP